MLVKVEAYFDGEFWCARGLGEDIFTQGRTLDELVANVREAVALHFDEANQRPTVLLLTEVSPNCATAAAG